VTNRDDFEGLRLSPADEAALDALVGAGFDAERVEPSLRGRARRVAGLLGLLETEPTGSAAARAALTDRVVSRVSSSVGPSSGARAEGDAELSADDTEALEAFVMKGYDASRTPAGVRDGARAHERVHGMITTLGPENERWIAAGRTVRTESVLATALTEAPLQIEAPVRRRSFRLADVLAAAAAILLVSAFTMPVLNSLTEDGRRRVCQSNLQAAGLGFGLYALSNDDALPMATAGFGGGWAQVGEPGRSQSANLFTLVRSGLVQPWELSCPGNEHAPRGTMDREAGDWRRLEEVSYSYRLMPVGQGRLDRLDSGAVVLADRSPVLLAGIAGRRISPEAPSPNHGREGQHLLAIDGGMSWRASPVLENGDNIWLPREIERAVRDVRRKFGYFDGVELPESPDDTFLGP
jgi:hypothetical protein